MQRSKNSWLGGKGQNFRGWVKFVLCLILPKFCLPAPQRGLLSIDAGGRGSGGAAASKTVRFAGGEPREAGVSMAWRPVCLCYFVGARASTCWLLVDLEVSCLSIWAQCSWLFTPAALPTCICSLPPPPRPKQYSSYSRAKKCGAEANRVPCGPKLLFCGSRMKLFGQKCEFEAQRCWELSFNFFLFVRCVNG